MNLWNYFLNNRDRKITKWTQYFPVYEKHFARWQNQPIKFLEIGVLNGGSLQMWQKYFGSYAKIVGIDIDPRCKNYESPGIDIRIGDQSDPKFLQSLIDEFGPFDVVLDDGSHHVSHVHKTFEFLYPTVTKNGTYLIEDLHAHYWDSHGGSLTEPNSMINISKNLIDKLNADHTRGQVTPDEFTKTTQSISFYDSMVVFDKGEIGWKIPMEIGADVAGETFVIKT